ncbi:MAG TPA: YoaK family protein [Terriglobales bacterium]|nr:YoaK family protein [Terriglobales bacterium]
MVDARSLSRGRSRVRSFLPGRDAMVLVLTWAASAVDAISYLGLGHVFTANMTGNTVLLGLAIGQGQGLAALRSIIALLGFVIGVALSAVLLETTPGHGEWPISITRAVLAEGVVLGVFTATWHLRIHGGVTLHALIVLSAIAMGIQSGAMRHLKVPGIATTYITGTITSAVAEFAAWLYGLRASPLALDPTGQSAALEVPTARRYHGAWLQAIVVLVYVVAALVSGILQTTHSRLVTFPPLIAVTLVALNGLARHRREGGPFAAN